MDRDKLMKMAGAVRTGGKGTVRRKKKAVHKTTSTDDKRLQNTLKRLGVNTIPGIEEVNIFKDNNDVVHFVNPKVQASIAANTYVISGASQTKKIQELLPGILNQMGPDSLQHLKKIMQQYTAGFGGMPFGAQAPGAAEGGDDDDVPDLVENFETEAK
uniref:Nascent polypeptide-associated complex subunit beta n=1 Tax=Chlamydomonas leiostraca TaxID=1034604 RepID=A0A7S0WMT2_9CHLO|mmetsp:Transcript_19400/g.49379  ORF Transcript_19400/g.49379 Transcript_19400/m.49379 type:complete len:158 (+) Transcript_19400:49-522(+)|eukprot:CAMPEP_0202857186 /NCGR_PEP_ID=MMETSP1391-20130828/226_1 /ASSEMBLY_ACC=CAM_ASM_000867 /TAXON_ID=1034604 /ORGANISM="Chlamydomonas leiostraca, Strain SAG 11-49" /LENGTH=157 /DNA_ID=CAMNT_0049535961 /DNA_START=47 /DNA_END=520 /DNA_ORIENTATION=+